MIWLDFDSITWDFPIWRSFFDREPIYVEQREEPVAWV